MAPHAFFYKQRPFLSVLPFCIFFFYRSRKPPPFPFLSPSFCCVERALFSLVVARCPSFKGPQGSFFPSFLLYQRRSVFFLIPLVYTVFFILRCSPRLRIPFPLSLYYRTDPRKKCLPPPNLPFSPLSVPTPLLFPFTFSLSPSAPFLTGSSFFPQPSQQAFF